MLDSGTSAAAVKRHAVPECSLKDALFGASYNRARYYDENAGRFLSEDPLDSGEAGTSTSMFTTARLGRLIPRG